MSVKLLRKIIGSNIEISQEHLRELCDSALGEYDLLKEVLDRQDEGHIVLSKEDHEVLLITRNLTKLIPVSTSGKSFSDSIKDPDLKKYFKSVLDGNESMNERDFSFGEGEIKTIRISFLPFMLNDVEYIDIRFNDITDALKKEMKLRNTEALASMTTMAAGVAHEINTPVASIKSNNGIMAKFIPRIQDPEIADIFKEINEIDSDAIRRISNIVVSLKKFVRLDEAELQEADINKELDLTLNLIRHETKNRIDIVKLYGDIPMIKCYPNMLNQVFTNILINACQAIEGRGKITISTDFQDNKLIVKIKDTGKGIPENELPKIFSAGYTTKGAGVGTGLGLAICTKIIEKHNGEISVVSEEGVGTEFSITIHGE